MWVHGFCKRGGNDATGLSDKERAELCLKVQNRFAESLARHIICPGSFSERLVLVHSLKGLQIMDVHVSPVTPSAVVVLHELKELYIGEKNASLCMCKAIRR